MSGLRPGRKKIVFSVVLLSAAALAGSSLNFSGSRVYADPKGIKYAGSASCTGCHGEDFDKNKADQKKKKEVDIWSKQDPHSKSFSVQLTGDAAKEISKKMGIADATTNASCLSCHSMSGMSVGAGRLQRVPLDKGILHSDVQMFEGVSCAACHGPSGNDKASGYLVPHKTEGWTQKQRAGGALKLYDEFGLFDTKDMKLRANMCYSCHAISNPELIAADHPHRPFEMNVLFTRYMKTAHFAGDSDPLAETKLWVLGQLVSLKAAAGELGDLARAKKSDAQIRAAYEHVLGNALMAQQICRGDAAAKAKLDADLAVLAVGGGSLEKIEPALKSMAEAAEQQADAFNAMKFERAQAEALLKNVAAEYDQAARAGLPAATQYIFALASLWGNLKDATPESEAKFKTVKGLSKILRVLKNDSANYTDAVRTQFTAEAKAVAALFPGGEAIPLASLPQTGAVVAVVQVPTPPIEPVKPPPVEPVKTVPTVTVVEPVKQPPPQVVPVATIESPRHAVPEAIVRKALEEYARRAPLPPDEYGKAVFCLECGMKWPVGTNFCGRCGTVLPKWEDTK